MAAASIHFVTAVATQLDESSLCSALCRWAQNEDGLPKLPITSVLAVLGVGTVIVEVRGRSAFAIALKAAVS
jgi:hypothetical protein